MRGRLWGPVVLAPSNTEGALPSRRPARHRVGPSSVAVLPGAERVRPIVRAPTASLSPMAVGCTCPAPPVVHQTVQKVT